MRAAAGRSAIATRVASRPSSWSATLSASSGLGAPLELAHRGGEPRETALDLGQAAPDHAGGFERTGRVLASLPVMLQGVPERGDVLMSRAPRGVVAQEHARPAAKLAVGGDLAGRETL
jgi:hypothetical protein